MTRWSVALAILLGLALVGCAPKPEITVIDPAAAFLYISSDPIAATGPLTLTLRNELGEVKRTFQFAQGERVVALIATQAEASMLAGSMGCEIAFALESGVETDVLLDQTPEQCGLRVEQSHAPGQLGHALATANVTIKDAPNFADATVTAVSLDSPPNPVPSPVARDEGGRVYFSDLLPGRYRFFLMAGDMYLGDAEVSIRAEPATNEVIIVGPPD